MKFSGRIYTVPLSLLLMVGTIHCAGPQSQVAQRPGDEGPARASGTVSRQAPPAPAAERAEGAPAPPPRGLMASEGAQETSRPVPVKPGQPQRVPLREETLRQMVERVPDPAQAAPAPSRPSGPQLMGPQGTAGPPPAAAPARGSRFVLNFDNADIYEVIRVMAEMMGINYIIDPRVKGVVNIRTTGQISTQEIFPIFQAILKMNGAAAVQKGILYEIVPFVDAKKLHTRPSSSREAVRKEKDEKYTIQIVSLQYIPVAEVSKMIKPFLSDGADIVEHPHQNILIVGDVASNIQKSLDLIDLFDVDIFSDLRVRIYPVQNSDAAEVAKELERIFSSLEVSLKSGRGVGITFTPISRINSLLAVSSIPGVFEKVEKWMKELDRVPGEGTQMAVFVYHVQNGKAKDLAEVLKQVYVPIKGARADGRDRAVSPALGPVPSPAAPAARGVRPSPVSPAPGAAAPTPAREEGGGVPEGEINIVVDETTNSLIIRAFQRDYKAIVETIKKLDIYPKQVLIEVLLAEVTLDDSTKYGLEFSTFSDAFTRGARTYSYTLGMGGTGTPAAFTSGLRYAITSVDRLAAAVHASATDDRLRVISAPHILASNNKEARIQVGRSEPILTNTYTTTGTTSPGVVEGTIEYKDIGIILAVTPRISDSKLVTLDISVEQSTVGKTSLGNLTEVPFFPKKTAKTTLSIMEKQTIVIGGLIEDKKGNTKSGVPFLSQIPILGALFGYHSNQVNKTETVLFLTPHVIGELGDSNRVTEEFRDKIFSIQKELQKKKEEQEKERGKRPLPQGSSSSPAAVSETRYNPATSP